jgi:hypothetical protein
VGGKQAADRCIAARWASAARSCGWLLLAVCACTAAAADGPAWERFRSEAGRFAVDLPAAPRITHARQRSLVGTIESAEYLAESGALELRVEHHDVPAVAAFFVSEAGMLERAQDDLVEGEEARLLTATETRIGDRLVREVRYRLRAEGGRDGRARFQHVGGRLYVQAALFPPEAAESPALERFFSSLEVWER